MPQHLIWWSVCAVLLFWAVGAYNRLVRLRSEALRAFTTLGLQLQRFTDHVATAIGASVVDGAPDAERLPGWGGMRGAADQFSASLAVARAKPLDAEAMAALSAASAVLRMAWQRTAEEDAGQPAATFTQSLQNQWTEINRQAEHAAQDFGLAVNTYNAAVTQFPAALLAWLFGFRKAQTLALPRA
jgi:LemA protein